MATLLSRAFDPDGVGMLQVVVRSRQLRRIGNSKIERDLSHVALARTLISIFLLFDFFFARVRCCFHRRALLTLFLSLCFRHHYLMSANGSTSNGSAMSNGDGLWRASTSAAPLDASKAVAHLSTYKTGDGLSMSELVDSRTNGGLTYNGVCQL